MSKAKDELAAKEENGKSLSPATVNRYLASLSHLLSVARKEWHWINDSPLTKVTRKREPRGRLRFLSDEERKRLLEACEASPDRNLYPVVLVALGTGMRLGEITGLTWDRVDLEKGVIILDETKNGDRRRVSIAGVPLEGKRPPFTVLPA